MQLSLFSHSGFRNLVPADINLSPSINIFEGANGAGKSSILEAVCLLCSGRSFRTNQLNLLTSHHANEFTLFARSNDQAKIGLNHKNREKTNRVKINGELVPSLSRLSKIYPTQVLCPESYHLIDAGPAERRKFLDWCLFHVEHQYHEVWKSYTNLLKQRNALLKSRGRDTRNEVEIWDKQLVATGKRLEGFRQQMLKDILVELKLVIAQLNLSFCDGLKLSYSPGYSGDFEIRLKDSFTLDQKRGFTQYGPHKADVRLSFKSGLVKDLLSRGQKKVLINALFLAQTQLLKKQTGKDSLFIIDDFTSELDIDNQKALLTALVKQDNVQILLSCLQLDALKWLEKGYNRVKMFHVEQGVVSMINPSDNELIN